VDLLLLSVGFGLLMAVPVIPDKLRLGTVACVVLVPFLLRKVARDLRVRLLMITASLWVVGQVVSDDVNGQGLRLTLPIILAITIVATTTTLVHFAHLDFARIRYLTVGVIVGPLLWVILVERVSLGSSVNWKYAFNIPVAIALMALTDLAWRRGNRIPSFLALGAICGLGVWSDSRGLAGFAAITMAFLLLVPHGASRNHSRLFFALTCIGLFLGALSRIFIDTAQAGLLGNRSLSQVQRYGSNPLAIIVNVRPELYQELDLFLQRPLVGWGSHPELPSAVYYESLAFIKSVGVRDYENLSDYWMTLDIPGMSSHSMAADTWARAGFLAVPFWILVIVLTLWAGTLTLQSRSSPLLVLWTMLVLWDTFFSPLTALGANALGAYLAFAVVTIATASRRAVPTRKPEGVKPVEPLQENMDRARESAMTRGTVQVILPS
jgi:hypothetical protein